MNCNTKGQILMVAALAVAGGGECLAAVLLVPGDFPTIQQAIDAANDGDTVLVAPGTYNEAINFAGQSITVQSEAGAQATTISAAGGQSAVSFPTPAKGGPAVLQGFRVTGGGATIVGSQRLGGGLYVIGGNVTVRDCVIANNAIPFGGDNAQHRGAGMYISGGSLRIENCLFESNVVYGTCGGASGGALYGSANLTVINSVFRSNTATGGSCVGTGAGHGGALVVGGAVTLINCTFIENRSSGAYTGGGAILSSGSLALINCVLAGNQCTTSSNGTNYGGAAIYHSGGSLSLNQCTIANNFLQGTFVPQSAGGTGGVFLAGTSLTVENSIAYGNDSNQLHVFSGNGAVAHSCVQDGYAGPGNIASAPLFVSAAAFDFRLQDGSPARDAGSLALVPNDALDLDGDGAITEYIPYDANGWRRIVNGFVDMGAHEWQRTCLPDISPSAPGQAGNGAVNVSDLLAVINAWGECDQCVGDVNGDNVVNVSDLLAVMNGWGVCP